MKFFTNKKITQKIIIALVTVIVLNFSIPIQSQAKGVAEWFTDVGGDLLQELVLLVDAVGDIVMGALNKWMLGTTKIYGSAMLDQDDINLDEPSSSLFAGDGFNEATDVKAEIPEDFKPDGLLWKEWKIPNFLYCPENIFANKIAALDVNFINKHSYTGVEFEQSGTETEDSIKKKESAAGGTLRNVISSWYKAFRNIAIVGLLIVLLYLGIRIMISSTAVDKAKYKENLYDWLVALCLVVVIHFIMAGIMMLTDSFTDLLNNTVNKDIYVDVASASNEVSDAKPFRTNLTGYIRFMAQSSDFGDCTAYSIMYLALVIYTCMFTFTYFKRFLYMAFFTMIAPLVALTYPIDKIKDGKAQAFDMWFKEYTMNAIIQPIHLVLYSVFVGGAMDLAINNPIYAIVAIGFLTPAEKFIKKMFGVESQTSGGLGEIAGGALAMKGIQTLVGQVTGKKNKKDGKGEKGEIDTGIGNNVIKTRGASSTYKTDPMTLIAGENKDDKKRLSPEEEKRVTGKDLKNYSDEVKNNSQKPNNSEIVDQYGNVISSPDTSINDRIKEEKARDEAKGFYFPGNYYDKMRDKLIKEENEKKQKDNTVGIEKEQSKTDMPNNEGHREGENDKNIFAAGEEQPNRWQRVKNKAGDIKDKATNTRFVKGMGSVFDSGKRSLKRATVDKITAPGAGKRLVYKVAKTGAKAVVKAGGMAAGAALVGTAAAAAGVSTGDLSKGLSTAVGGLSLGASAGANVGGKLSEKVASGMDSARQAYMEGAYTKQDLKEKKQKEYDRSWKRSEDNYKYLRSQGMNSKQAKEFLESADTQKYLNAGITDIKLIHNASKLAKEKDYDIDHAVARAKLASEYSDGFSRQEQNEFRKNITERNSNITDDMAFNLIDDIKEIKGLK